MVLLRHVRDLHGRLTAADIALVWGDKLGGIQNIIYYEYDFGRFMFPAANQTATLREDKNWITYE